jgi:hypothetical protein
VKPFSDELTQRVQRARVFANDNNHDHPLTPSLSEMLERIDDVPVIALSHRRNDGYTQFGNAAAVKMYNAREQYKLRSLTPQPTDSDLNNVLQVRDGRFETLPSESVRLGRSQRGTMRPVSWMYFSGSYRSSANTTGAVTGITILLEARDAERLFDQLQQHPEDARAFFFAAAKGCDHYDSIWEHAPINFQETDVHRRLIFVNQHNELQPGRPPLDISMQVWQRDGTWKHTPLPTELDGRVKKAMDEAVRRMSARRG